jgi:hypothetical protein
MNRGAMNLEFGTPYHHKTVDQCRTIGRRGGLRSARNRRQRRLAQPSTPLSISQEPERATAHEASILLDARFPWLKDAWMRPARRPMA